MPWGDTTYGELPSSGEVKTGQAAPAVSLTIHLWPYRTLSFSPVFDLAASLAPQEVSADAYASDLTTVVMTFSPALADPLTFSVAGPGSPVVIGYTISGDGSYHVTVLGMIPLQGYIITVSNGMLLIAAPFTAVASLVGPGYKLMEAITYACGKALQELAGMPATKMTANLDVTDTVVQVTSTLGFPNRGWLRMAGLVLEYTGRTTQSFTLVEPVLRYPIIPEGTRIFLAVELITPDGANVGTESL